MKLNLGLIGQLLHSKYEFLLCDPTDNAKYTDVYVYQADRIPEGAENLVIIQWHELRKCAGITSVVCIGGGVEAKEFFRLNNIRGFIFIESSSTLDLFIEFKEIFSKFSALEIRLLHAICDKVSTKELLNCVGDFLQCNVMLFGVDLKLLEYSDSYVPEKTDLCWKDTIKQKRCMFQIPKKYVNTHIFVDNGISYYSYINDGEERPLFNVSMEYKGYHFATISFLQVMMSLFVEWRWVVEFLCELIKPIIVMRYNTQLDSRNRLREHLRLAFLQRNVNCITINKDIFQQCGWMEKDYYRIILIYSVKKNHNVISKYLYEYEYILASKPADSVALVCEDFIVVVMHNDACDIDGDILTMLQERTVVDSSVCSIGMKFYGLKEIVWHYLYTIVPFHMYDNDDGVRYYRKIFTKHLLNEIQGIFKLDSLCHWAAHKLREHDLENGTEYLLTLETYLLCNKSLNDAANRIYIHRSTMYYRMKCINEIVKIDLNDPKERLFLLLSCIVLRESEQLTE